MLEQKDNLKEDILSYHNLKYQHNLHNKNNVMQIKKDCCISEFDLTLQSFKMFCAKKQCYTNCCSLDCNKKRDSKIEFKIKTKKQETQKSHINSKHIVGRIALYVNYQLSDKALVVETIRQIKSYCNFNNYILDYSELIQILKYKLKEFGLYVDTCNQYIINKENKMIYNFRYSNNK